MTVLAAAPGCMLMTTLEFLCALSWAASGGLLILPVDALGHRIAVCGERSAHDEVAVNVSERHRENWHLPDAHADRAVYQQRTPTRVVDEEEGGDGE